MIIRGGPIATNRPFVWKAECRCYIFEESSNKTACVGSIEEHRPVCTQYECLRQAKQICNVVRAGRLRYRYFRLLITYTKPLGAEVGHNAKERLVLVWAITILLSYSEETWFSVRTDHGVLWWTLNVVCNSAKLRRWQLQFSELKFYIVLGTLGRHQTADIRLRLETEDKNNTPFDNELLVLKNYLKTFSCAFETEEKLEVFDEPKICFVSFIRKFGIWVALRITTTRTCRRYTSLNLYSTIFTASVPPLC